MNPKLFAAVLGSTLLLAGGPVLAKSKPSLLPFAGSYTGTALSTTAEGTLSGSSTLTFTGRKTSLRGTFLYTGILNSGNLVKSVTQTFTISKTGVLNGRVTVGELEGAGFGQAHLNKKTLTISATYLVGPAPGTTLVFTGAIVFKGKRATWSTSVTSTDATYNGTLSVAGRR